MSGGSKLGLPCRRHDAPLTESIALGRLNGRESIYQGKRGDSLYRNVRSISWPASTAPALVNVSAFTT